jgi:lysophospholipase L1-like esterase
MRTLKLASFGSSFASGPTIPPVVCPPAGRSGSNYAHLLAARLGATLTDTSVWSATLLNLFRDPQDIAGAHFPPQIDNMPADADVVLVLGGGNDINYIGGLFDDSVAAYALGRLALAAMRLFGASPFSDLVAAAADLPSEEELGERYGAVLDAVHAKAPVAQVVVVEYLTMLGHDVRPGVDVPFSAERVEHHRGVAAKLYRATVAATDQRSEWCLRVPVTEMSEQHGIGSKQPWVLGLRMSNLNASYHPTAEGMKAIADILYETLQEGKSATTSTASLQ